MKIEFGESDATVGAAALYGAFAGAVIAETTRFGSDELFIVAIAFVVLMLAVIILDFGISEYRRRKRRPDEGGDVE